MQSVLSGGQLSAGSEAAPQPEPFAREAKFLSESKALGRDVRVMLEGVDKWGGLFGQVTPLPLPLQEILQIVLTTHCQDIDPTTHWSSETLKPRQSKVSKARPSLP